MMLPKWKITMTTINKFIKHIKSLIVLNYQAFLIINQLIITYETSSLWFLNTNPPPKLSNRILLSVAILPANISLES